jgi:Fe2+ or Zn2+ uptake regulation protein
MKNLSPRQREIINLLSQKEYLSAAELQERFEISQATAYREIQSLVEQGYAAKTPGGIGQSEQDTGKRCLQCKREAKPSLAFIIETSGGQKSTACCAHCGLMALEHQPVASAMATDYFYGTIINAAQAWYVLESQVAPCCSPSVLTFASQEDASRFAAAFNGKLADFSQARQHNTNLMRLS